MQMGYSSTWRVVFLWRYLTPLAFFGTLALTAARPPVRRHRKRTRWALPLTIVPLLAMLLFSDDFLFESYYTRIWNQFGDYGLLLESRNASIVLIIFTGLAMIIIAAIIVTLGANRTTIALLTILGMGFASKAILAFSPTVWVSGDRTNLYLLFAFSVATLLIVNSELLTEPVVKCQAGDSQLEPDQSSQGPRRVVV